MTIHSLYPNFKSLVSVFLCLTIALTIWSCKDDTEDKVVEQLLGSWQFEAYIEGGPEGETLVKKRSDQPSCQLDDRYFFQEDGTLLVDLGATQCDETLHRKHYGSWSVDQNGQLSITQAAAIEDAIIGLMTGSAQAGGFMFSQTYFEMTQTTNSVSVEYDSVDELALVVYFDTGGFTRFEYARD